MYSVIRDSFLGLITYHISGRRLFKHPEEKSDFELPEKYRRENKEKKQAQRARRFTDDDRPPQLSEEARSDSSDSQRTVAPSPTAQSGGDSPDNATEKNKSKRPKADQKDEEEEIDSDDIVDWYGPDDPANPQNWPMWKKSYTVFAIMLMTSSVYMGSSIYSPAILEAAEYFGLGQVTVTLGLSLFVAGYGIGPLFLAPITEIPQIGRTSPYIITLAIFTILQVPTALVNNFAGFAILRFIAGFVGSPPLATGGASIQDIFAAHKIPYAMGLYGVAAASAPALAPVISGFAVAAKGWRWAFWEMLWLSGFTLVLLSFTLPETSPQNILYRRAVRLRRLTGNPRLRSQSEIDSAKMTGKDIAMMTLVRPFSMTFTEPIVAACNLYIGLIYAILYSYFESFPIVYVEGYMFGLGVSNLPFLALFVGALVGYTGYCIWNWLYFEPIFVRQRGKVLPEERLPMSMLGAFFFPICLFWFGWTANRTSWVSPLIASSFFGIGATCMFMPFLTYLPSAYPQHAASVLASNDFFRSMMGAGMPLAANPLFKNLGIEWGNTLLGCLTVLFIPIPFVLYKKGNWLRNHSPMALHDNHIEDMDEDPEAVAIADREGAPLHDIRGERLEENQQAA